MVPHEAALTRAMIIILEVHVKRARHICFPLGIHHCILNGNRSMVYVPLNATMIMTSILALTAAQLQPHRIEQWRRM